MANRTAINNLWAQACAAHTETLTPWASSRIRPGQWSTSADRGLPVTVLPETVKPLSPPPTSNNDPTPAV